MRRVVNAVNDDEDMRLSANVEPAGEADEFRCTDRPSNASSFPILKH